MNECILTDGTHGPVADGLKNLCAECAAIGELVEDDLAAEDARENDVIGVIAIIIEVRRTSAAMRLLMIHDGGSR